MLALILIPAANLSGCASRESKSLFVHKLPYTGLTFSAMQSASKSENPMFVRVALTPRSVVLENRGSVNGSSGMMGEGRMKAPHNTHGNLFFNVGFQHLGSGACVSAGFAASLKTRPPRSLRRH